MKLLFCFPVLELYSYFCTMSRLTAQHFIFVLDLECESPVWCFMGMVLSSSEVLVVCFQNDDLKEEVYTTLNEYKWIIVI